MDLARVVDLRYGILQEIDISISQHETNVQGNLMLTEVVGLDQIAEVCLMWMF